MRPSALLTALLVSLSAAAPGRSEPESAPSAPEPAWCAPELETLPGEICHFSPQAEGEAAPRTLVLYLHGVIQPGTKFLPVHTSSEVLLKADQLRSGL